MTKVKRPDLFRDSHKGKIAGVCAGLAKYFGWEVWLVRIIAVSGLFLSGSLFIFAYVAMWLLLDKKNLSLTGESVDADETVHFEIKSKVWQSGQPPQRAFRDIRSSFEHLELRLQRIERFVTSKQYTVRKEINDL